jgi:uncharacterized protein (DUF608 family)
MKIILDNGIEISLTDHEFQIYNPWEKVSFRLAPFMVHKGPLTGAQTVQQIADSIRLLLNDGRGAP